MNKIAFFIFLLCNHFCFLAQNNVGIGTYTPHSSSILELKATDKGILIPRLSTTERFAIANPENSLLVFDTNFDCFYYFTSNNGWISLCPGNSGSGNSSILLNTSSEPTGVNCSFGGFKIEFGFDSNSNLLLDNNEVNPSMTKYVCNGGPGVQGPQGAQGPAGINGTNGTNGQNSLVKTTPESAGANCATGGVKLEYGLDANNNGILDFSEIDATLTQYVCNGSAGPQGPTGATGAQGVQGVQGPAGTNGMNGSNGLNGTNGQNSLVKTTPESAGANCATGGVKLEYGLDANNNGILDFSEIDATLTQYVCNGSAGPQGAAGIQGPQGIQGPAGPTGSQGPIGLTGPSGATGPQGAQGPVGANGNNGLNGTNGLNSLVKTTVESAGANCSTGGVKLEYGLDANSNGVLDVSEIDATLTQYVCNGTAGPQGAAGAQGLQGIQGPAGPTGATGPTGPSLFSNMQVYATPGTFTYTIPAGVTKIMVEVWGGGGGGGNSSATVTGALSSGAGGGYGRSILSVSSGTSYSVVVGAGGNAGGGDGGNSSFGTLITSTGGIGGNSIGIYKIPDGGTSNGTFNITGGQGNFDSSNTARGPYGGGSYGSHGGRGGTNGILASPGNSPGGGGGGGAGYSGATWVPGAAGGAGRVVIWY